RGGDQGRDGGGGEDEDRAEQDAERRARGRAVLGTQVQEQRGQAQRGAEHHAGGHVPAAAALDADHLHERGRAGPEGQVTPELVDAEQERAGAAGGGDVGQRVAGERLAPGHGEHAHHGRGDRDHRADGQGYVDRPAGEEARLEDVTHYRMPPASSAATSSSSTPSGAATTKIRPCTRITSTCWPYSRDSTSGWTTSSVSPPPTRPPAT